MASSPQAGQPCQRCMKRNALNIQRRTLTVKPGHEHPWYKNVRDRWLCDPCALFIAQDKHARHTVEPVPERAPRKVEVFTDQGDELHVDGADA